MMQHRSLGGPASRLATSGTVRFAQWAAVVGRSPVDRVGGSPASRDRGSPSRIQQVDLGLRVWVRGRRIRPFAGAVTHAPLQRSEESYAPCPVWPCGRASCGAMRHPDAGRHSRLSCISPPMPRPWSWRRPSPKELPTPGAPRPGDALALGAGIAWPRGQWRGSRRCCRSGKRISGSVSRGSYRADTSPVVPRWPSGG
jgi:hypothetical protein